MLTGLVVPTGFVGYKSVNLGTAASGYITVAQYVVESDVLSYDNPIRMLLPTHSIVVASPSSTLSDKSFLTSGDHPYVVESDVLSYDNPIRMLLPTHSIVVASPSSTLSDKSFLTSGDHPVGPVCGMHMMADTAAGNSKDPTELCQSVKKRLS
ncbi:hypothetical protein Tco_1287907 [Tanacetum coccineum]